MLKTKPSKGKHFVADPRQLTGPLKSPTRKQLVQATMRELTGVELIYAIRCKDGLIKIGFTRDIVSRRRPLNTAHDAILAVERGTFEDEQRLHSELRASVARGREYYHPTSEVLAYVNRIRERLGVEPTA